MSRRLICLLYAVLMLSACAGIKPYPADLEKNLRVDTTTRSGSFLKTVHAGLHIYEVDEDCRIHYRGTIRLDQTPVETGLPLNRLLYLEFYFSKSGIPYNTRSVVRHGMLVNPRPAYEYAAEVEYVADLYKVRIQERRHGETTGSLIERKPLASCVKAR